MSFSSFTTNLNDTSDKVSNAVKIHQLDNEYHAKTLGPLSAFQMAPYFSKDFGTLTRFYASYDPPIIASPEEQPRAAVEFVPEVIADAANGIVGVPAVQARRAWIGGLPIPNEVPSAATMFPNVAAHQVTTQQYNAVTAAVTKTKTITERDTAVKDRLMEALPTAYITSLQTAEMGPGHITTMSAVQLLRAALQNFGTIYPHEIPGVISSITAPFTSADLMSSESLHLALVKRQQKQEIIPAAARPPYYQLMPLIHNAFGTHPTGTDLINKHFEGTPVLEQTIPTLVTVVDLHYTNLIAKHAVAIDKWFLTATAASTIKHAAGNPAASSAAPAKSNECHRWMTGQQCSDYCKTSGKLTHTPSCKGMCSSLKVALADSRTFHSMSTEDKTAARAAENQKKQDRSKVYGKPQGKNPNNSKQPRDFGKGGTIAAAPASNNRRNYGRASANATSADDDVISSDED